MAGPSAATRRWAPRRLTSTVWAKSLGAVSSAVPGSACPALTTTMSIGPTASSATRANSSTDGASARSSRSTCASPPAARMPAATSSHFSTRRAPSTTGCPAAARASAVAAPIPEEAPVTTDRPSFGVGDESRPGHGRGSLSQRAVTVVGRLANPRTLMEWTRRAPGPSMS